MSTKGVTPSTTLYAQELLLLSYFQFLKNLNFSLNGNKNESFIVNILTNKIFERDEFNTILQCLLIHYYLYYELNSYADQNGVF